MNQDWRSGAITDIGKPKPAASAPPATPAIAAHVGALGEKQFDLSEDQLGKLVGVLSERDYTRKIALQGRSSKDTRVKDIMTRDVLYVTPRTTTSQCMALMSEKKIRHLPVLDGNTVVGMISIRDILDDIIADHEETIAQLENYIRS